MDRRNKRISIILESRRKERKKINNNAFSSRTSSASLSDISNIQIDGHLAIELLKKNIGKIFPLILSLVNEGESIASIERLFGMNKKALIQFIEKRPALHKAVQRAKDIRRDSVALKAMLE